ncbi:MAG TPA: DUF4375 domain-containing protein, partial [Elusimicrobiota bacterium]|nr:DUF4375 domain-containing protein [Elusimicrobiota bacterium]
RLSQEKSSSSRARWDALSHFCAFADIADLTPVQRTACLAYWYSGLVLMGGHREYFFHSSYSRHSEIVTALHAIGADEQAEILIRADKAVKAAQDQAPEYCENRHIAAVENADLAGYDDAFECCPRSIQAALMDYLDRHEPEFIKYTP